MLTLLAGCGGDLAFVAGRASRPDGKPVVGANVIARSEVSGKSVSGVTDSDGHYSLALPESGAGVPPGEYKVAVVENRGMSDNMRPATISAKYSNPDQSGLSFTVVAGDDKVFDIVVDPP